MDKRSLILFISNAILLQLMLMINTSNVWIGINLFLGPIFIIAPLYLRTDQFFISTLLTGFCRRRLTHPIRQHDPAPAVHWKRTTDDSPTLSCRKKLSSQFTRALGKPHRWLLPLFSQPEP